MAQLPTQDHFTYTAPRSGMAVTALVLGVLGCIPGLGVVAIVLGAIAMRNARREPERYAGFGAALAGVICGTVFTLTLCGVSAALLPAIGVARQATRHAVDQSNLQQIGMALHMYATDNQGAFPESADTWQGRLTPTYIADADAFKIRIADESRPASYVYRPGYVAGRTNDQSVVLVYESNPHPFAGRVLVLFADGHVEKATVQRLESLLKSQEAPSAPAGR